MNIVSVINSATMGKPEKVRPMILWTILEYLLRGAPYGVLLMVIWELFIPLQNPGTPLNVNHCALYCAGLLVSLILLHLVSGKSYMASFSKTYDICAEGRLSIADHLRKLPMGFYNSRDPGDIGAYIVTDYANIETLLSHFLPQVFGAAVMPVFLLVCLSFFSWELALAAFLVIPFAIPFTWISTKIIRHLGIKHQKTKVGAASRMIEYIQGIKLIKAFNIGGAKFERLENTFRKLKTDSIKLEGGAGPTMILSSLILNAGLTIIMLAGFTMLLSGTVSLPVYVMFLVLGTRVYEPLFQALMFTAELNYMKLGVERVESLRTTVPLADGNEEKPVANFDIEFCNVKFSYHETEVLKGINLKINSQSLTALVGPSGSGKTTVTRLIARFWDVDSGEILMSGKNIKSYKMDDLLANISMVFQDVYLFNDTILNNIAVGKAKATKEEVIAATKKAQCHEFIDALPDKYDTLVGEGGSTLSGGEKQRISIARAILKNAPIILLDEATASLDPENELYIQEAINDLVKNKTVIIIAHRLHTIAKADKIIVIDNGRVVEEGTHKKLLEQDGLYKNLWHEQQRVKGWKFEK